MPKQYEAIRNKLAAKGMDYDRAQMHAARIYNAAHPSMPMSAAHPEGMSTMKAEHAGKMKAMKRHAMLSQMKGR